MYFCKDTISPDAPKLLKHDLIWTYGIKHSKHMSKYRLLMKKYSTTLLMASDRLRSLLLCAHRARGGGADWEHKSMVLRHDNVLVWIHNSDSEFRSYKQTPSDVTAVFLHNSSHSFVFLLEGTNTSSTCCLRCPCFMWNISKPYSRKLFQFVPRCLMKKLKPLVPAQIIFIFQKSIKLSPVKRGWNIFIDLQQTHCHFY